MNRRVAVRVRNAKGGLVSEFELSKYPCVVGRGRGPEDKGQEADLAIDDVRCSRRHAVIEEGSEGVWLVDKDSTNGSFTAEGKRVDRVRLRNRTRIRIGSHWLEFRVEGDEDCTVVHTGEEVAIRSKEEVASASPVGASGGATSDPIVRESGSERRQAARQLTPPQPTPPKSSASNPLHRDSPDWIDSLVRFVAAPFTVLILLAGVCARLAYWEPNLTGWRALILVGTVVATVIGAALLAGITWLAARVAGRTVDFRKVWMAYISLISARQLCALLVSDAQLLWPERRVLEPWLPMVGSLFVGLFLCFNGRWILGATSRRMVAIASAWAIAMIWMFHSAIEPQPPLWMRVVESPKLTARTRRIPANVQVSEQQFFAELTQSLSTLRDEK